MTLTTYELTQANGEAFTVSAPGGGKKFLRRAVAEYISANVQDRKAIPACLVMFFDQETCEPIRGPLVGTTFRVAVDGIGNYRGAASCGENGSEEDIPSSLDLLLSLPSWKKAGWYYYHPIEELDVVEFVRYAVSLEECPRCLDGGEGDFVRSTFAYSNPADFNTGLARFFDHKIGIGAASTEWQAGFFVETLKAMLHADASFDDLCSPDDGAAEYRWDNDEETARAYSLWELIFYLRSLCCRLASVEALDQVTIRNLIHDFVAPDSLRYTMSVGSPVRDVYLVASKLVQAADFTFPIWTRTDIPVLKNLQRNAESWTDDEEDQNDNSCTYDAPLELMRGIVRLQDKFIDGAPLAKRARPIRAARRPTG